MAKDQLVLFLNPKSLVKVKPSKLLNHFIHSTTILDRFTIIVTLKLWTSKSLSGFSHITNVDYP